MHIPGRLSHHPQFRAKTTLAKELALRTGATYIPLDHIWFKPGWQELTREEFRTQVLDLLSRHPEGWIVDGNYTRKLGGVLDDLVTDVICMSSFSPLSRGFFLHTNDYRQLLGLDISLWVYLPRLILRTLKRIFGYAEPCAPGCEEIVRRLFSRESIIWCAVSQHWRTRRNSLERLQTLRILRGDSVGLLVVTDVAKTAKLRSNQGMARLQPTQII